MFSGNQRCPGVWNSFPFLAWDLSMQPRTHIWFFNQFICTGACHVVQIWIIHINALKTQLMYKNIQTNPGKSKKFTQHSCCSMLTWEKNLKAIRGNGYHFVPKGGTFPTENHHAFCEKLRFVRIIYPNLPKMGQNLYHNMLMPLHYSMPSFMNFRRVFDLLEFKNHVSQFCGRVTVAGCDIHSHFLHGT